MEAMAPDGYQASRGWTRSNYIRHLIDQSFIKLSLAIPSLFSLSYAHITPSPWEKSLNPYFREAP